MSKRIVLFIVSVLFIAFVSGCNKEVVEISKNDDSIEVSQNVENGEAQEKVMPEVNEESSGETQEEITHEETLSEQPDIPETELTQETVTEGTKDKELKEVFEHISVTGISLSAYEVTLSVGHTTMPYVTMIPQNATDKGEIWQSSDTSVATVDYLGNIKGIKEGTCVVTVTSVDNKDVYASVNVKVIPEAECTYIDGILIANKTYALPQSYAPGWDATASEALNVMFTAAKEEGITLFVKSGYRSYIDQKIIYNDYVKRDGKELADTYSARPGHSEHQTGLAFDLNSLDVSFENTPEGKWLAENSYKYGFIIRYPKGKEDITGYIYEPWHVRYLGEEKAKEVYESGLCLEEFLGITSVYSY